VKSILSGAGRSSLRRAKPAPISLSAKAFFNFDFFGRKPYQSPFG